MVRQLALITLGCIVGELVWRFVIAPKLDR